MPKRRVYDIPGLKHATPIPMAARVGNMLFTSGVMGRDPETGKIPADPALQSELIFRHLRSLLEQAGGTTGDIGHLTVFVKDLKYREDVDREWLKMFPQEDDRPSRHTLRYDLPGDMLIQIEMIAVLDQVSN